MKYRKITAFVLAVSMAAGSSMAVFADEVNSATGSGDLIPHLNKEITTVTLPTDTKVATVFNYVVDPEALIKDSGQLKDGTVVTGNNEGVYFTNVGGTTSYSNTSDAVEFKGQNSVAVDVTVKATVSASEGNKDIALVADDAALTAATEPALLMQLKVGTDTKAIMSDGATAKATIEGVPGNFAVKAKADKSGYEYGVKSDADDTAWKTTSVQLIGKTNKKVVPAGMTAPAITLTWTVAKHEDYTDTTASGSWGGDGALWLSKDGSTGFSTTGLTVEVSDGGTTYSALTSDQYEVSDTGWVSIPGNNIAAGIGGTPTGTIYVRITDGNTRYIFENK